MKFTVKTRTMEAANYNPHKPKGQLRYGKWVPVATYDNFEEADSRRAKITGLVDKTVFCKGVRLLDEQGFPIISDPGSGADTKRRAIWEEVKKHG